jgi:hypothetical protein
MVGCYVYHAFFDIVVSPKEIKPMAKQNPEPLNHGGIVIGKRRYNQHVQCSGMH